MSLSPPSPETVAPSRGCSKISSGGRACRAAGLLFLLLLGVTFLNYDCAFYLKSYPAYFAYGRSLFQLRFYLAFMGAGLLLQSERPFKSRQALSPWSVGLVMAAMIAYSLHAFFTFISIASVSWIDRVVIFGDGNVSSNSFLNIHVLKSVLAEISGWFGASTRLTTGDNGAAYLLLVPRYLPIGGALILIGASALFLFNLGASPRRRGESTVGISILHVVATFIWLKNFIDGGFVSPESILAGVILIDLARAGAASSDLQLFRRYAAWSFGVVILVILVVGLARHTLGFGTFIRWGTDLTVDAAALFFIPALLTFLGRRDRISGATVAVLGFLMVWLRADNSWFENDYTNLLKPIRKGQGYAVSLPKFAVSDEWSPLDPSYFIWQSTADRDFRPIEIYRKFNLRPGITYVTAVGPDCDLAVKPSVSAEVRVLKGKIKPTQPLGSVIESFQSIPCKQGEWCTERVYARLSPCVPLQAALSEPLLFALASYGAEVFIYRNESLWGRVSSVDPFDQ